MKRTLTTVAASLALLVGAAAPAAAWPHTAPLTLEQADRQVELCAGNPPAGLCTDVALTARASRVVFADTADLRPVRAICAAHRMYTHTWRMGFCRDHIYDASNAVAHDWSVDGVISRAAVVHGFIPQG